MKSSFSIWIPPQSLKKYVAVASRESEVSEDESAVPMEDFAEKM